MAENQQLSPIKRLEQEIAQAKNVKDLIKINVVSARFIANLRACTGCSEQEAQTRYEREAFGFIEIFNTSPELMECDPFSIFAGFVKVGAINQSFLSGKLSVYYRGVKQKDGNYKKFLVVEPDAHGRKEMLEAMPSITKVDEGVVVFNKDEFLYDPGQKKVLKHTQSWPLPKASKETVKAGYCKVHFADGHIEDIAVSLEEIEAARSKSTNVSYVDGQKVKDGGELWVKFYGEAVKKTTYNRAFKILYKMPMHTVTFPQFEAPETQDTTHEEIPDQTMVAQAESVDESTGEVTVQKSEDDFMN